MDAWTDAVRGEMPSAEESLSAETIITGASVTSTTGDSQGLAEFTAFESSEEKVAPAGTPGGLGLPVSGDNRFAKLLMKESDLP